jgi:hypothetical protein
VRTEIRDGHAVDVILCELDDQEQHRIAVDLAAQGIRVAPVLDPFHVLHLWALVPLSTEQEVQALAAFHARTDCRLAWHQAVA